MEEPISIRIFAKIVLRRSLDWQVNFGGVIDAKRNPANKVSIGVNGSAIVVRAKVDPGRVSSNLAIPR
jgi:hypothetical protein